MRSVCTLAALAGAVVSLGAVAAQAAVTATFLGEDDVTGGAWATPGTKPFSASGVYGDGGYYMMAASPDNSMGNAPGSYTVYSSLPSYVQNGSVMDPKGIYGSNFNIWGGSYLGSTINTPTGANVPVESWLWDGGSNQANYETSLFSFTLQSDAHFTLGVIYDVVEPTLASVRVDSGSGSIYSVTPVMDLQTLDTTGLTGSSTNLVRYAFFDISGNAGDSITVSGKGWLNPVDNSGHVGSAGILFSAVPEPGSLSLLGAAGAMVLARRRARK